MLFGESTKMILAGFSACMMSGIVATGLLSEQTWPYYTAAGIVGTHLTWQVCIVVVVCVCVWVIIVTVNCCTL